MCVHMYFLPVCLNTSSSLRVDILVSVVCLVQEAQTLSKSILHSLSVSVSVHKPSISSASRNACNNIKFDVHGSG